MTAPLDTAKNLAHIGRLFGLHEVTLSKYRREHGAPPTLHIPDWKAFFDANPQLRRRKDELTTTQLRDEKLKTEVELNRIKIAKESRRVIDAEKVDDLLLFLAARIKAATYQTFVTELPPKTAGLDVSEVRKYNREGADAICLNMQHAVEDWRKEQSAAREASAAAAADET